MEFWILTDNHETHLWKQKKNETIWKTLNNWIKFKKTFLEQNPTTQFEKREQHLKIWKRIRNKSGNYFGNEKMKNTKINSETNLENKPREHFLKTNLKNVKHSEKVEIERRIETLRTWKTIWNNWNYVISSFLSCFFHFFWNCNYSTKRQNKNTAK